MSFHHSVFSVVCLLVGISLCLIVWFSVCLSLCLSVCRSACLPVFRLSKGAAKTTYSCMAVVGHFATARFQVTDMLLYLCLLWTDFIIFRYDIIYKKNAKRWWNRHLFITKSFKEQRVIIGKKNEIRISTHFSVPPPNHPLLSLCLSEYLFL